MGRRTTTTTGGSSGSLRYCRGVVEARWGSRRSHGQEGVRRALRGERRDGHPGRGDTRRGWRRRGRRHPERRWPAAGRSRSGIRCCRATGRRVRRPRRARAVGARDRHHADRGLRSTRRSRGVARRASPGGTSTLTVVSRAWCSLRPTSRRCGRPAPPPAAQRRSCPVTCNYRLRWFSAFLVGSRCRDPVACHGRVTGAALRIDLDQQAGRVAFVPDAARLADVAARGRAHLVAVE